MLVLGDVPVALGGQLVLAGGAGEVRDTQQVEIIPRRFLAYLRHAPRRGGTAAGAVHFELPVGHSQLRPAGRGCGLVLFQTSQGLAGLTELPLQPADNRPMSGDLLRKTFVHMFDSGRTDRMVESWN
ncbi:hypothetical protein [Streptomyces yangpuensis]|uniref:hypothetical protein n=1 Tax=Streptomyces yangpuensis TaxID=1648182 RepID=UPI0035DCB038